MKELIPVLHVLLAEPFFMGRKNFEKRLDPERHAGLELYYDEAADRIVVLYQGKMEVIKYYASFAPKDPTDLYETIHAPRQVEEKPMTHVPHPMTIPGIKTAQVETPQMHVQGGPGRGKKRDS